LARHAWRSFWIARRVEPVADAGNPVSQAKTIAADGSVSGDGRSSLSGYSIISGDSLDGAIALAKGCPVLSGGSTIEVCETFEAM
jgi:hypothetical protein